MTRLFSLDMLAYGGLGITSSGRATHNSWAVRACTRSPAMAHMHTHILPHSMCLEDTLLVEMLYTWTAPVTTLGGDKFIHLIPRNALDIVVMFRKLPDAASVHAENMSSIVRTTGNYIFPCWAPSEIINFVCCATVRSIQFHSMLLVI